MAARSTPTARIVSRTPLFYADGADAAQDRPAHVRSGSGIAVVDTPRGRRLLVVQDDASFLALVDPLTKTASSIALPPGPGGRRTFDEASGTKKHKLDLESVGVLPTPAGPLVLSFGSGSSEKRERVVVARVDREPADVRLVDAHALYAALRAHPLMVVEGSPAELNLEGMAPIGARVRFFQRGNGAGAVDATFDVDTQALLAFLDGAGPTPAILEAQRYDLGTVHNGTASGVRLTFTDAHVRAGDDVIYVIAAAEASPNAVDDGEIVGCAFGVLGSPLTPILDESGAVFVGKPEGLCLLPEDPTRGFLVVDMDNPALPAELYEIRIG